MVEFRMQTAEETVKVFEVSVPAEEVERQFHAVTEKVQKSAALPGFRKGKVPTEIVTKKFNREIHDQVLERLIASSYQEVLDQSQTVPIQQPRVENLRLDRGQPLTYQLRVETLPPVKVGNYQGLKLKQRNIEVTEAQIQEVLEGLRQENALLVPVEARACRLGDIVTLDMVGKRDGKTVPGTQAENYVLELGTGRSLPDFENQVAGLEVNDSKTFSVTFPTDYPVRDIAEKTVEFTVTLKAVQEKKPPALDDEFAKQMGKFSTLDELKAQVRQDLAAEQERQNRRGLKEQILQHLGKSAQAKIPEVLINRSLEKLVQEQERRLIGEGRTWEQSGTTPDAFKTEHRGLVEQQWRANLALREIARLEQVEVSPDEIEGEVVRLARASRQSLEAVRSYLDRSDHWDDLRDRLRDDKTLERIIQQAKISSS